MAEYSLDIKNDTYMQTSFYGDLVYKFKKNVGRADFSDQFRKIIVRYKRIGYSIFASSSYLSVIYLFHVMIY